jgi:hypothetical protein
MTLFSLNTQVLTNKIQFTTPQNDHNILSTYRRVAVAGQIPHALVVN